MRIFVFVTLIVLASIFIFNWLVDPYGVRLALFESHFEELIEKNEAEDCAFGSNVIFPYMQVPFKRWLLHKHKPEVLSIGSSRTFQFRRNQFEGGSFVNMGAANLSSESYAGFLKLIQNSRVKYLLVGVEIIDYRKTGIWQYIRDVPYAKSSSTVFRFFGRLLTEYDLILSDSLFKSRFSEIIFLFREFLSLGMSRASVALLEKHGWIGTKIVKHPLPTASALSCLLYKPNENPVGAYGGKDGSVYDPNEVQGKAVVPDTSEYLAISYDKPLTHWRNYDQYLVSSKAASILKDNFPFSRFRLEQLRHLLREAKRMDIKVVGFVSPFPSAIWEGFEYLGLAPIRDQFTQVVTDLFATEGGLFVHVPPAAQIGCVEPDDFYDGWHPNADCMWRLLQYLNQSGAGLPLAAIEEN